MRLEKLVNGLPSYAEELKTNVEHIFSTDAISTQQLWGAALASAMVVKQPDIFACIFAEAQERLGVSEIEAAQRTAAIMGMNNMYFSFSFLANDKEFSSVKHALSYESLHAEVEGVSEEDIEFWALAASSIGKCEGCIRVHARSLEKAGWSKEKIMWAPRIAAIVHALAVVCGSVGRDG